MENANTPAYPIKLRDGEKYDGHSNIDGLTKREYFAVMAMQGAIARESTLPKGIAQYAIQCADALLAALDKTEYPCTNPDHSQPY